VERAAEAGDYVKVSYTPSLEGEDLVAQFEEHPNLRSWAAVKESWEEAGTDEAKNYGVPSVIDALVGMAAEETKSVQQTIPEDFLIESLCGKEVEYAITVHEVRERVLPEIDEAFLNSVNAESLEDFKAQILDNLEQQKKDQQHQAKHRAITQKLVEAVDFAIPESTLETERQRAVANIVGRSLQNGMAENQLEQHKAEIFEHANQSAARDAKLSIILSRIAKKEGIELSNEDLSRAAYSVATQRRQKVDEFVKELQKDSEQMREFQVQVLMAKTAEFIMEKSVTKIVSA
jgi:trigger factor